MFVSDIQKRTTVALLIYFPSRHRWPFHEAYSIPCVFHRLSSFHIFSAAFIYGPFRLGTALSYLSCIFPLRTPKVDAKHKRCFNRVSAGWCFTPTTPAPSTLPQQLHQGSPRAGKTLRRASGGKKSISRTTFAPNVAPSPYTEERVRRFPRLPKTPTPSAPCPERRGCGGVCAGSPATPLVSRPRPRPW